jgi:hypothetical protein
MRLLIDTNQYPNDAVSILRAGELKANGVWSLPGNSPGLTAEDTKRIIAGIGSGVVVTEEGGIDVHQLLEDPNWTGGPANINGQRTLTRSAGYNPSRAMVYYEFGAPGIRQTCLTPHELSRAYILEDKTPLLALTRDWSRGQRARVKDALSLPRNIVVGVCFEIEANVPLIKAQGIVAGIRYVRSVGREAWVLMAPRLPSVEYEADVDKTLFYLKRNLSAEIWEDLNVVLAVYTVEDKGTTFFGETNSMLAAVKVARGYR